jgi:ubiquitin thioesterase protein OTUB1
MLRVVAQSVIDSTVQSTNPLMAELMPMSVLRAEYEESSEAFIKQIDFLSSQGYEGIRRSRGDGDCFYRCRISRPRSREWQR